MFFRKVSSIIKFALIIIAVFAVLIGLLFIIEQRVLEDAFVEQTVTFVASHVLEHTEIFSKEDFGSVANELTREKFENYTHMVGAQNIIRVKIWNFEERVIFSDDESIIGQTFYDNPALKRALSGETATEMEVPENLTDSGYGKLLEVYVPVFKNGDSKKPIGVVEAYFDLMWIEQTIDRVRWVVIYVTGFMMLGSVVLLLVALRIMIQNPISELTKAAREIEGGNFSYRVAKRTEDEIGRLADAFNHMAARIENYYADLSEEVKQKTKNLNFTLNTLKKNNAELENTKKTMLDALENLRIEKELIKEGKAKDEAILANIGDGMVVIDRNNKIMLINKQAEFLLDIEAQKAIGKNYFEIWDVRDEKGEFYSSKTRPIGRSMIEAQKISGSNYFYVTKTGRETPVSCTITPVILNGQVIGAVDIFRDISKEKELDRAKTEFISIASHQLRTPLAAIYWLVDSLKTEFVKTKNRERQKNYLEDLSAVVSRAVRLVEDLLHVSRLQLGTVKIEEQEMNIFDFVNEFVNDMRSYALQKNHELIFKKLSLKCSKTPADPKILRIIMQNLVSNAIDYSPAKTKVTVSVEQTDGVIKIYVTNQGPPIPNEEKGRLFQRFYRGPSAVKMKTAGTGLGLYLVKQFVENLKGQVGFESEPGRDTVFWFTVPCQHKKE